MPYPLTGATTLRTETPWEQAAWLPIFLDAIAGEAEDGLQLLMALERTWFAARRAAADRRSTARAAVAVGVMAAAQQVSATSLGRDRQPNAAEFRPSPPRPARRVHPEGRFP